MCLVVPLSPAEVESLSAEYVAQVESSDGRSSSEGGVDSARPLPVEDDARVDVALERSAPDVDAGGGHRVDALSVELPCQAEGGRDAVTVVAHLRLDAELRHQLAGVRVVGTGEGGHQGDLVVALGHVLAGEEESADAACSADHVRGVVGVEAASVEAAEVELCGMEKKVKSILDVNQQFIFYRRNLLI